MTVTVRLGTPADLPAVGALYLDWNYRGRALPDDLLVLAEHEGRVVGVVRLAVEHGHEVLRGMRVQPDFQRTGVGTRMLALFVQQLRSHECFAIPYTHLLGFYGQAGFKPIPGKDAPRFLAERAESYRAEGLEMSIVRRLSVSSAS